MSEIPITRRSYSYRRRLDAVELMPAIGIGVGVGLAAFYVMKVLLERTPLVELPEDRPVAPRRPRPARS